MDTRSRKDSNITKIIVESNIHSYAYDKKSYKPEILNGIISKYDWDNIFNEATKLMGVCWNKKKVQDQIKLPQFMIVCAIISVILILVYTVTLYIAAISEGDNTVLIIISILSISLGTLLAGILATYNFKRKIGKFQTLDEIMQIYMTEYLAQVNLKYKNKLEFTYNNSTKFIECDVHDIFKSNSENEEKRRLVTNNEYYTTENNVDNEKKNENLTPNGA
jgi:hypothetical protein